MLHASACHKFNIYHTYHFSSLHPISSYLNTSNTVYYIYLDIYVDIVDHCASKHQNHRYRRIKTKSQLAVFFQFLSETKLNFIANVCSKAYQNLRFNNNKIIK